MTGLRLDSGAPGPVTLAAGGVLLVLWVPGLLQVVGFARRGQSPARP